MERWRTAVFVTALASVVCSKQTYKFDQEADSCTRTCLEGEEPRTCEYNFEVESYHTLSNACFDCPFNQSDCARPDCVPGNGLNRSITVINRMLPGPAIQVCEGDTLRIHVRNDVLMESTTIHWHGAHQRDSPHMDGVPMVTQCPIVSGNTFTYTFKATPAGTHFYHSHSAIQRSDGVHGAMIVREPVSTDPHGALYDADLPEHVVVVGDWLRQMARTRFTGHHHANFDNKPESLLINGIGAFENFTHPHTGETFKTPRHVFHVTSGQRYRMRVISNAGLSCPIQISVDHHNLTMIASDGRPFEPFEVESFVVHSGERYDFVLAADVTPPRSHWVRAHGLGDCTDVHQEAILRYAGASDEDPEEPADYESGAREGMQLNPLDSGLAPDRVPVAEMISSFPNEPDAAEHWAKPEADSKYYLDYDFSNISNPHFNDPVWYPLDPGREKEPIFTPQIQFRSLVFPPTPLLTQYEDIPQGLFCETANSVTDSRCNESYCECLHVVKVPLGDVTELILIDRGQLFTGATHPFHLHGYSARVVAYDKIGSTSLEEVKRLDEAGHIRRNLNRTVLKDTLSTPSGGYSVLRFHADNPGFWLLHCHIDFHLDLGMGLVVQVGEISDMKPKPKNYPTCGNWEFEGYISRADKATFRLPAALPAVVLLAHTLGTNM